MPSMSSRRCSSVMVVLWLLLVSSVSPTTIQASDVPSIPILARLSKDPATSLYTITIKHGGLPLVVDLSGSHYWSWSRCPPVHRTIPCRSNVCQTFHQGIPRESCSSTDADLNCTIFGGGQFHLMASSASVDLAEDFRQNQIPYLKYSDNGGYYLRVNGINVNNEPVAFPPGAFDLDAGSGEGGVMLSTTLTQAYASEVATYTTLRSDIYHALFNAFDAATSGIPRGPAVHPFEMCYQASALGSTRLGYAVANIELLLNNGRTWLIPGGSSLVQVNDNTVCFAFVEMITVSRVPGSPAVLFGGYQFEDHLLLFDLDKETLNFSGPLAGIQTSCSNFNFTMTPIS